ncbi:MAG: helix-turn-helix transcriptional regulator [Bacteroidales bacterium]|nr:helix-turn-helix transcriptional regulator [Bacteroidales bacterium]
MSNIHEQIKELNEKHSAFDLEHEKIMIQMRFMSEVEILMEEKKINKKQLAKVIGTSASYITQLFRGNKTLNLETIAKFQNAFEYKFGIEAKKDICKPITNIFTQEDYISLFASSRIQKKSIINIDEFTPLSISIDNVKRKKQQTA